MIFHINELVRLQGYFPLFLLHWRYLFYYRIFISYMWPQGNREYVVHEDRDFRGDLHLHICTYIYIYVYLHIHIRILTCTEGESVADVTVLLHKHFFMLSLYMGYSGLLGSLMAGTPGQVSPKRNKARQKQYCLCDLARGYAESLLLHSICWGSQSPV